MRTTTINNKEATGSLLHCFGQSIEFILNWFQLLIHIFVHMFLYLPIVIAAFLKKV